MYELSKVAFVDTETTGLHPEYCAVWEIALIVDNEEHLFQHRVPSNASIDDWVLENTRFKEDYDKYTALSDVDTADKLDELLTGRHLVGACPWFDSERLHRIYQQAKALEPAENQAHPWHYHLIDVESLILGAEIAYTDKLTLPFKSDDLSRILHIDPPVDRHTAMGDAKWAKQIFEYMFGPGE